MKSLIPWIIEKAGDHKYEVTDFPSGAVMIDIWVGGRFFVIQIDGHTIGLSEVTDETGPFDIIPDQAFTNASAFQAAFLRMLS